MDTLAGEQATPLEDLAAGATGKAEVTRHRLDRHNAGLTPLLKTPTLQSRSRRRPNAVDHGGMKRVKLGSAGRIHR